MVTAPPRPAGRGGRTAVTPIHETARHLDVHPILTPARLREAAALGDVLDLAPDVVVLADYGQIVPAPLLDRSSWRVESAPSLLPRYRGATPIPAAILAGDAETGVTLMRMDAGLDTGPIVVQTHVPLAGDETTPLLEETLEVEAAELLTRYLGSVAAGQDLGDTTAGGWGHAHAAAATGGRTAGSGPAGRRAGTPGSCVPAVAWLLRRHGGWAPYRLAGGARRWTARRLAYSTRVGSGPGTGRDSCCARSSPQGGDRMSWDAYLRGRPAIVGSSIVR